MACALTQGYPIDCRDSAGGVKVIYLIETENVDSITLVDGVVTVISKAAGTRFWKYQLIKETSNFADNQTSNEANGTTYSAQTGEIILNKRQVNERNEIMLLAKNNLTIVVIDRNNNAWLYGKEFGMTLGAAVAASGTAWADRNGYTLPFSGNEKEPAPSVSDDVIATLESSTGTIGFPYTFSFTLS